MRKANQPLSLERLKTLLSYDSETGVFVRRQRMATKAAGTVAGTISHHGYVDIAIDNVKYLGHRLAWFYVNGEWPGGDLDHRDRNRANNVINNLRLATKHQNQGNSNRSKNNKSGFKGVVAYRKGWASWIHYDGRNHTLGTFKTPEEAHAAYVQKAVEVFGEFATGG